MQRNLQGIIFVDKPGGITSHDVVDIVRKRLGIKRVGHTGTLDPLATGLLIILVGRVTKAFQKFSGLDKKYEATLKLGAWSSTGDSQGKISDENQTYKDMPLGRIEEAFKKLEGDILQVPPQVSALRHKGKRLYKLARQGKEVSIPPRRVRIHSVQITGMKLPYIDFYIHCSKGTYVRKFAHDIGDILECGAHITRIRRTHIGKFSIEKAVEPGQIDEKHLIYPVPAI